MKNKKKFIDFIRPTTWKIIIFIILLIATTFIPKTALVCGPAAYGEVNCGKAPVMGIGYPVFYGTKFYGDAGFIEFSTINFVTNLVIYYLIACFIILIFKNFRRKK